MAAKEYRECILFVKSSDGERTFARQLGSAKFMDNGTIYVDLDAVPAAKDGKVSFAIMPKRAREGGGGYQPRQQTTKPPARGYGDDDDDSIPF